MPFEILEIVLQLPVAPTRRMSAGGRIFFARLLESEGREKFEVVSGGGEQSAVEARRRPVALNRRAPNSEVLRLTGWTRAPTTRSTRKFTQILLDAGVRGR